MGSIWHFQKLFLELSQLIVLLALVTTTNTTHSSEIATKTEQAKTTGSKASVIVVSRGAREGQNFIQSQKYC